MLVQRPHFCLQPKALRVHFFSQLDRGCQGLRIIYRKLALSSASDLCLEMLAMLSVEDRLGGSTWRQNRGPILLCATPLAAKQGASRWPLKQGFHRVRRIVNVTKKQLSQSMILLGMILEIPKQERNSVEHVPRQKNNVLLSVLGVQQENQ